jgi:glycosyltransferase involved in cell wall biosynthesis/2-polyprenyl-3-methyl-5-hydroxy-6-metoxy-1,4-benzoquinol methylase
LQRFSSDYLHCSACETLVLANPPGASKLLVEDDERDFYGKHYFEAMARNHGLPPLEVRARADLCERCLHWLRGLVKYKLPPARILELGCAHGGFVALMRWAGFDAVGLDLSPGLTQWARDTFDIPVLTGPIEAQTLPPGSLDAVVMMDVLEHLREPEQTLRSCVKLLKRDGILFLQSPQYPEGMTFEKLSARDDPFLKMLRPEEHLYLFSKSSVRLLLNKAGCEHVCFEPAIFSFYDMSLVAGRNVLTTFPEEESLAQLLSRPSARLPVALLDFDQKFQAQGRRYAELEAAYALQSEGLEGLKRIHAESEADRTARLQNMIALEKLLAVAHADLAGKQEFLLANQARLGELEGSRQLLAKQYEERLAGQDALLREIENSRQLLAKQYEERLAAQDAHLREIENSRQLLAKQYEERLAAQDGQLRETERSRQQLSEQNDSLQHPLAESQRRVADLQFQAQQGAAIREEQAHLLDRIRHSYVFAALRKLGLWRWLDPPRDPSQPPSTHPETLHRIVIDLTPVLPGGDNGGAKVMTLELIRLLARMAPKLEFILLTSDKSHHELATLDGANVRRICANNPSAALTASDSLAIRFRRLLANVFPEAVLNKLAAMYRELSKRIPSRSGLLRQLEADLLFCPFTAPFFFDATVPAVSVVYDLQHLYYPQFFEPAELEQRNRTFRLAWSLSSKIVCISEYVRQTVLQNAGISPDRVETIHILLAHRCARPTEATLERVLREWRLESDRFLLYPANFWLHKNHELLLTAFGMYRSANPESRLRLVLTGAPDPRRDLLIDASRRMGLMESVVFPGYLPEEHFSALLHACLAIIFPSLFEGFGMPLLEGMAAGKPLLCSNLTSLPEVAGTAALMFDPKRPEEIAKAIMRIECDAGLRDDLIRRSRERLTSFNGPEDMARRYLKVFEEAFRCPAGLGPEVDGVFSDGWLGERAIVIFGKGSDRRSLLVKLSVPQWVPTNELSVHVRAKGSEPEIYTVLRGEQVTISRQLNRRAGRIELFCSPVFQPIANGLGNDSRSLTCRLESAQIIAAEHTVIPLVDRAYVH